MSSLSTLYKIKGGCKSFYNIMPVENIPSVIRNGILSFYETKNIEHSSVAMNEVQLRREMVKIPNGEKLHSYANLYFTYHNPMLYKRKDNAEELCVLAVSLDVLNIEGCVVTDQNAATDLVRFYEPKDGIDKIDFKKVFQQSWTHNDYYEQKLHKAIKCAEVLIPNSIPYEYIKGAYVVSEDVKNKMIDLGFDKKIVVESKVFYR